MIRSTMRLMAGSAVLVFGSAAGVAAAGDKAPQLPPFDVEIRTLSNRADLIGSGDALVEVRLPVTVPPHQLVLRLNGQDVSSQFEYLPSERRMVALLTGLREGSNELVADANGRGIGRPYASLAITNHSRGGPIFSGPQMEPWICATADGATVTTTVPGTDLSAPVASRVSGLDASPVDEKCNAPSKYTYYYQPKSKESSACTFTLTGANPCFEPYDPANPPPREQIADFTNDRGDTVKSIVRVERGTMNRGIYELVAFYDPSLPNKPWAPQQGWNGKLLWKFGASAAAHRFQTPTTLNTIFDDTALRQGFMVASASLNNNGTNANHVLAAESLMMVKEHIAEQYGPIRYTIGNGCSGGSIQQHTVASAYPGLLDGIQPNCSYQDQVNIEMEIKDCGLLAGNYFQTANGAALSAEKRSAIGGNHLNPNFCQVWVSSFVPAYNPSRAVNCGAGFPQALVYDPVLRPNGVRCDLLDHEANRLGTFIDVDGYRKANKVFDNVGVQYGLNALREGVITPEEFVQLNEGIGSYSPDLIWSGPALGAPAPRVESLASTLERVYFSGMSGDARHLSQVAIIDLRGDQNPAGDIHANWRSWSMRERLLNANGTYENQVIWAFTPGLAPGAALARKSFLALDRWLAAVEADTSQDSRAAKIIANRPSDVRDMCLLTRGDAEADLTQEVGLDTEECSVKYQASPRQAAGGPLAEDIFKCQLQPLDFSQPEYAGFTAEQRTRLQAVFPSGVCDWSKPGVGQQTSPGWITFANSASVPLPPPPVSR